MLLRLNQSENLELENTPEQQRRLSFAQRRCLTK